MQDLNLIRKCDHLLQDRELTLSPSTYSWFTRSSLTLPRRLWACTFMDGINGYIGLGYGEDSNPRKDFWQYNMETDDWTEVSYYPGGERYGAACFFISGYAYVGLGSNGMSYPTEFYKYDPYLDVWTSISDFGGVGRIWSTGFAVNNKGYVGLGYNGSDYQSDFYKYDVSTNIWTVVSSPFLGNARHSASCFVIDNIAYLGLGYDGFNYLTDFYSFDGTDWLVKASFSGTARINATSYVFDSKGYVGLGYDITSSVKKDFYEYVPFYNSWAYSFDFAGGERHGAFSFYTEFYDLVFIGQGYDGSSYKQDLYKLGPLQWTASLEYPYDNNIMHIREWNTTEGLTSFTWHKDGVTNYTVQDSQHLIFNSLDGLCLVDGTTLLYPKNFYLANYTTPKSYCPKCYTTGLLSDVGYDFVGRMNVVDKKERVGQMIQKALLIKKGANIYHPEYGSILGDLVGQKLTPLLIVRIQQSITDCINQLIIYQNEYVTQLDLDEIIVGVDNIDLNMEEEDSRNLILLISVILGDFTKVKASFTLKL